LIFNAKTEKKAKNEVFIKASRDFLHGAYASKNKAQRKKEKRQKTTIEGSD